MVVLPFRLQVRASCPAHCALAASLAAEFAAVDAERLDADLIDLAAEVGARPGHPEEQLAEVGRLVPGVLEPVSGGPAATLLLDRAARTRRGHPDVLALLLVEAGRRLGWPLGVVASPERHFVAHERLADPLVLDPVSGRVRDSREIEGPLRWRCAHESCAGLLDELERRWHRAGDLGRALRVAELRLDLPVDDDSRRRAGERLHRLRAALN